MPPVVSCRTSGDHNEVRLLVAGDLHLKPAASDYDLSEVTVPNDVDAVLVLGDLTHRDGRNDRDLARRFVRRTAKATPTVYVPGNHDPAPFPETVVESVADARVLYRAAQRVADANLVGWGCEQRSLAPAIDQCSFEALDPRCASHGERRYEADRTAEQLESACYDVVCGTRSVDGAAADLGIDESNRDAFASGIDEIASTFDRLAAVLTGTEQIVLASHVPPFNTPVDRHHAVGSREIDQEHLHVGSIAIKLAVREFDVFATLSGHSHEFGFERLADCEGRPYCLNLGHRGIGTVMANPTDDRFTFTQHSTGAG